MQCKYKTFKWHNCQKVGHFASVCCSKQPADQQDKDTARGKCIRSVQETVESDDDSGSDSSEYFHNILQLGTRANKFLLTIDINSRPIEMEVESGAECSTIPLSIFEQFLTDVCMLSHLKFPYTNMINATGESLKSMTVPSQQCL